jgi:hypothetical protein
MDKYLYPHQISVANYMSYPENDRLLIFHSLGTGKSFTSLACARLNISLKTVIITGGGFTERNFQEELFKFNELFPKTSVNAIFYRWKTLTNKNLKEVMRLLSNCFIIVDEVHNLRDKKNNYSVNKCYSFMKKVFNELLSLKVSKILLLSGTPIVDDPRDIKSIQNLLDVKDISNYISKFSSNNNYTIVNKGQLINNVIWPVVLVEMLGKNKEEYYNLIEFYQNNNFCREISDCTLRCKYLRMINNIENGSKISEKKKVYIYCDRVNGPGIKTLLKLIKTRTKWKYIVLNSKSNKNNFNSEDIEKSEVIIGSKSSCESINIYDLSQIHILTPHWNSSHISQAIGRGTRLRPNEDKNIIINVYRYVSYVDKPLTEIKNSIDLYKYHKSSKKYLDSKNFLDYEYGLLPKDFDKIIVTPISKVLDHYEEIIQNGFTTAEYVDKEELKSIKSIGRLNGYNIQKVNNKIINVINSSPFIINNKFNQKEIHDNWLTSFYYVRNLTFDEKVDLLEKSIMEKKLKIMKIFKNSIFLVNECWYHIFYYKKPRYFSYNVSYFLTKEEGLTKKMVKTINGNCKWILCSIEEEKKIWGVINPRGKKIEDYSVSLIYTFIDNVYRIRINKPELIGIEDKRKFNRGKNIKSYTKEYLEILFKYLTVGQYMYLDDISELKMPKNKKELIENIKWIFLDQDDVIII